MKKRILAFLCIILFAISCGVHPVQKNLETTLKTLKSGDVSKMKTLKEEELGLDYNSEPYKTMFSGYKKMEYKIKSVKEEGNKAIVNLDIKMPDLTPTFPEFIQKVMAASVETEGKTQEEIQKKSNEFMKTFLQEKLNSKDLQYIEKNINVIYEKKDGKWVLDENAQENYEFLNITSFGFLSLFQQIGGN